MLGGENYAVFLRNFHATNSEKALVAGGGGVPIQQGMASCIFTNLVPFW